MNKEKKQQPAIRKEINPKVIWLTGISGAGKTTLGKMLVKQLQAIGEPCTLLDGDELRQGLNKDLGFSDADRHENVRRVAEVAKLMTEAGLHAIVALISPFQADRDAARSLFEAGQFIEIHIDTSLQAAEKNDVKGLYKKARDGSLPQFTGISSTYEAPLQPELTIETHLHTAEESNEQILQYLQQHGLVTNTAYKAITNPC